MSRPKVPALPARVPSYPDAREAIIHRRRFMTLVSGSAVAVMLGCKDEGCDIDKLPGQEPRLAGKQPRPETDTQQQDAGQPTSQRDAGTPLARSTGGLGGQHKLVVVNFDPQRIRLKDHTSLTYSLGFSCTSDECARDLATRALAIHEATNRTLRKFDYDKISRPGMNKKLLIKLGYNLEPTIGQKGAHMTGLKFIRIQQNMPKRGSKPHPETNDP